MAKKDKKKSGKSDREAEDAADSSSPRGRAQDLVEEITSAAQRVRSTIEDLRVLDDLKGLRSELEALERRVAELEQRPAAPAPKAAPRRTSTARASAGTKPAGTKAAASSTPRRRTPRAPEAPATDPAPDASAGRS